MFPRFSMTFHTGRRRSRTHVVWFLLFAACMSCGLAAQQIADASSHKDVDVDDNDDDDMAGLSFLALGDWGGMKWWPYWTRAQVQTATGMATVAAARNKNKSSTTSFVVGLGDNFYNHGQATPERFHGTFEIVYHQKVLKDMPWYMIAGNHDHKGNVTAQLTYHAQDARWIYPSLFHVFKKSFRTRTTKQSTSRIMTVEFIMIDTVVLAGMNPQTDTNEMGYFDPLPGPPSPTQAKSRMAWVEHYLAKSTADYLFVAGHYPVYSACSHGNTQYLIDNLEPLLQKYNVTAYLSGHEHCAMHIVRQGMDYLLTGTGIEVRYNSTNSDNLPTDARLEYLLSADHNEQHVRGGFASFHVPSSSEHHHHDDSMKVSFHDQDGQVLYSTKLHPRARLDNDRLEEMQSMQ